MINGKTIVAGPCSVESYQQLFDTVVALLRYGEVDMIRCGVWKPRSRPGGFEGTGLTALKWMSDIKKAIPSVKYAVEVADTYHVQQVMKYGVDGIWLGARTTCNPFMVQKLADSLKGFRGVVFVKNPLAPDLNLWIGAIERIKNNGITNVFAVHRGFSTCLDGTLRNEPLWFLALELRKSMPDLPILCDPSHMAGDRRYIEYLSSTAIALGFDGLMIECHAHPDAALTDAAQQITPERLHDIIRGLAFHVNSSSVTNIIVSEISSMIDELQLLKRKYNTYFGYSDYNKE